MLRSIEFNPQMIKKYKVMKLHSFCKPLHCRIKSTSSGSSYDVTVHFATIMKTLFLSDMDIMMT